MGAVLTSSERRGRSSIVRQGEGEETSIILDMDGKGWASTVGTCRLLNPEAMRAINRAVLSLCMPSRLPHILQLLNARCFVRVRKGYSGQAELAILNKIVHDTKLEFVPESKLIRRRIQREVESLSTFVVDAPYRFTREAKKVMRLLVLMRNQVAELQAANQITISNRTAANQTANQVANQARVSHTEGQAIHRVQRL